MAEDDPFFYEADPEFLDLLIYRTRLVAEIVAR